MKKSNTKKPLWKRLLKVFLWLLFLPVLLAVGLVAFLYFNQDDFVQKALTEFNETLHGKLSVKGSHISPFKHFPDVSIALEDVEIFENKNANTPIVQVENIYLNFDLRKILKGKYSVNQIHISKGNLLVVQDSAGNFNLTKAFEMTGDTAVSDSSALRLGLKNIRLNDVKIKHINQINNHVIDLDLQKAKAGFRMSEKRMKVSVEGTMFLTLINGNDTSFFRNKKIELNTAVTYNKKKNELTIKPSDVYLEDVSFSGGGKIGFGEQLDLDLQFKGEKSDFNLIFAFLPKDMADYMKKYKNAGKIFFDVTIKGKVGGDVQPSINATFGCKEGFFTNTDVNKTVDKLFFTGYFTNGAKRNASTSEFGLTEIKAQPEQGDVKANIIVRNFDDPNVNMDVSTDFDLQFLAKFFQLKEFENLSGKINLKVFYNELVDITAPPTFSKLKQGVESELHVRNLTFKYPGYPHTIKNVNIDAAMRQKSLFVENCSMQVGNSDVFLILGINNLPAMLLHKKEMPLDARLVISSNTLDIKELTTFDTLKMKTIDEVVTDFQAVITVKTNLKNFSDKKMPLPEGEFTIEKLGGKFKYYPNKLDNVTADVLIDSSSVKIRNFKGISGKSDFSLKAEIKNYKMWFDENLNGTSNITYDIVCDTLRFGRTFSYKKVNYIPEHIRREVLRNFKLKGTAQLSFDKKNLTSATAVIENAEVKSKIHPLPLSNVQGKIKYQNERLSARKLNAKLGDNDIIVSMAYYLGKDTSFKKDNRISLKANYLNINELMNYDLSKVERKRRKKDTLQIVQESQHDTVFNVFTVPFSNMKIKLDIAKLKYNNVELDNLKSFMRMTKNHQLYIDTLDMDVADGHLDIKGVFDGSNPEKLVFRPKVNISGINLSKLLLRFDNFGQDYIVTNNIKGKLSGNISGRVRMHSDLVPIIDNSRIKADIVVYDGELNNYAPMMLLKDYFKDKNVNNIRFDTLADKFEIKKGVLYVPNMNINSSLGFLEIGGQQAFTGNGEMDYKVSVPLKMVGDVGIKYLFGKNRAEVDSSQVDEIQYRDKDKKIRFVTINMKGTSENMKVSLGKK